MSIKKQPKKSETHEPDIYSIRSAIEYLIAESKRMKSHGQVAILQHALSCLEAGELSFHSDKYDQKDWTYLLSFFRALSRCSSEQINDFLYVIEVIKQDEGPTGFYKNSQV